MRVCGAAYGLGPLQRGHDSGEHLGRADRREEVVQRSTVSHRHTPCGAQLRSAVALKQLQDGTPVEITLGKAAWDLPRCQRVPTELRCVHTG